MNPTMRKFALLLPAVGLLEIWVFLRVAQEIGLGQAFLLLIVVSVGGVWLTKRQGAKAWRKFQAAVEAGQQPEAQVLHGLFMLIAGALLTVPGFVTSVAGLILMIPVVQTLIGRRVASRYAQPHAEGVPPRPGSGATAGGRSPDDEVIDVEVVNVERTEPD